MLYTWGSGSSHQTAQPTIVNLLEPTVAPGPWVQIASGEFHTLGLQADGTLWAWGLNSSGQCGQGDTVSPVPIPIQIGVHEKHISVFAGPNVSFALEHHLNGGVLRSCGTLLTGRTTSHSEKLTTLEIVGSPPYDWKSVSSRYTHAHGIRGGGQLWSWGRRNQGQCGVGDQHFTAEYFYPTLADGTDSWREVHAGHEASIGIKHDGTLWGWGRGDVNGLGYGNFTIPTLISGEEWSMAAMTLLASLAIKADGTLWSCGFGSNGALGHGNTSNKPSWTQVGGMLWSKVYAGYSHVLAVNTENQVWVWGTNSSGQLGLGDTTMRTSPTRLGDKRTP